MGSNQEISSLSVTTADLNPAATSSVNDSVVLSPTKQDAVQLPTTLASKGSSGLGAQAASVSPDAWRHREIAEFLRNRREKLKPADVGIVETSRRRTPGLRREEVAELAGVGTTWYTWLEQGRDIEASSNVLSRVARALRLTDAETKYLFTLAGKALVQEDAGGVEKLSPSLQNLIDNVVASPAVVIGRRYDVIGWNQAALELLPELISAVEEERNCIFNLLSKSDPDKLQLWEPLARRTIAEFRANLGDALNQPWIAEFISKMKSENANFATFWKEHEIADLRPLVITLLDGSIRERVVLRPAEDEGLLLVLFNKVPPAV